MKSYKYNKPYLIRNGICLEPVPGNPGEAKRAARAAGDLCRIVNINGKKVAYITAKGITKKDLKDCWITDLNTFFFKLIADFDRKKLREILPNATNTQIKTGLEVCARGVGESCEALRMALIELIK